MSAMASIDEILTALQTGKLDIATAKEALASASLLEAKDIAFDAQRTARRGFAESVLCVGKSLVQIQDIARLLPSNAVPCVLFTKITDEQHAALSAERQDVTYFPEAALAVVGVLPEKLKQAGIVIAYAGTSDTPVAYEALHTCAAMGYAATLIADIGVAGLHRMLSKISILRNARCIIAIAGMDGAMPSVLAGLVAAPIIAVPTSGGYGPLKGLAPLLAMLHACAPGVSVVNIDNGFGAAYCAVSMSIARNGSFSDV